MNTVRFSGCRPVRSVDSPSAGRRKLSVQQWWEIYDSFQDLVTEIQTPFERSPVTFNTSCVVDLLLMLHFKPTLIHILILVKPVDPQESVTVDSYCPNEVIFHKP